MAIGAPGEQPSLCTWFVPATGGDPLHIDTKPGEVVTIVGANGSGKSALATWLAEHTPREILRRVLAQRRLWFESSGPAISAAERHNYASNIPDWDQSISSRYTDYANAQRGSIALFDLMGAISSQNQKVADLVYGGRTSSDVVAEIGPLLLDTLNAILLRAELQIELVVTAEQSFDARHRALGRTYPIQQLSDGERSALLLAAEVLTAAEGSVLVIDEPERHLHRSISSGLIVELILSRPDCAFVVLTHDLELAAQLSTRPGRTLSLTGVTWEHDRPASWDLHAIASDANISSAARRAILGGRRRILFIEGQKDSLDQELYGVLYPDWTLTPSGGCDSVIRSVTGVRETDSLHWVEAAGIVDGDGRDATERAALEKKGVRTLPVSEVENLFYLPDVLAAVTTKVAASLYVEESARPAAASQMLESAKQSALSDLAKNDALPRLARAVSKVVVTRRLVGQVPEGSDGASVSVTVESPYKGILDQVTHFHASGDYRSLLNVIPVRNSGFREQIASELGYKSFKPYQRAALVCIREDETLRKSILNLIGDLPTPN